MAKKETKEKPQFNISADASQLQELIRQASEAKTRAEIQNDEVKAARQTAKDKLGVEPATFNTILRWYHKRERDADESKMEEASTIYDKLFNADPATVGDDDDI